MSPEQTERLVAALESIAASLERMTRYGSISVSHTHSHWHGQLPLSGNWQGQGVTYQGQMGQVAR